MLKNARRGKSKRLGKLSGGVSVVSPSPLHLTTRTQRLQPPLWPSLPLGRGGADPGSSESARGLRLDRQITRMLTRRSLAAAASAVAGASALVAQQWWEYEAHLTDCSISEEHLPLSAEAQPTQVCRIPGLLTAAEVAAVHELAAELRPSVGSAGRNENNQAAAYRTGKWETIYLSTDGLFAQRAPWLRERLVDACRAADAKHGWGMLDRATTPLGVRCVEYHTVEPGGSLPFPHHYDAGSLITIDVMLSDAEDFQGGAFSTLEVDGESREHSFAKGDALVFVSHKFHSVAPVTAGTRNVLVMELWEGEERTCTARVNTFARTCILALDVRASHFPHVLSRSPHMRTWQANARTAVRGTAGHVGTRCARASGAARCPTWPRTCEKSMPCQTSTREAGSMTIR